MENTSVSLAKNQFPGLIVDDSKTYKFQVRKCPEKHAGQGRVLINYKRRDGSKRFQIVQLLTPSGRRAFAAVIGHYDAPEHIKMDHDLRKALGVEVNEETPIEVRKCGYIGTLYWYLTVPDPLVRVPAFLALLSLSLALISVILALGVA